MKIVDAMVREKALNVTESFIVQAPAGSGKTELLTQRLLALLAFAVDEPEAILAMTFTRKAAQEMRQRVMHALIQAKDQSPIESAHQQKTRELANAVLAKDASSLWGLLQNPGRLRIQTFDSLCAQIVRQLPISSRLGSEHRIIEQSESLYQEAAKQLLDHLDASSPYHQALQGLLSHLDHDVDKAIAYLTAMLGRREQWGPILSRDYQSENNPQSQGLLNYLQQSLHDIIEYEVAQTQAHFSKNPEIASLLCELWRFAKTIAPMEDEMQKLAMDNTLPETSLMDLSRWQILASWLLTQKGEWRKALTLSHGCPPQKSIPKTEKPLFDVHRANWKRLFELLHALPQEVMEDLHRLTLLPPADYYEVQSDKVAIVSMALRLLAAELERVFALHGQMDFTGIALASLRALGDADTPTDLSIAMQSKLQAILVDEFQDTSILQFELLQRLLADWSPGDGRSLFLVGDPMQSIYRFRQAEVGLFLQAKLNGIAAIKLESLTLINNFRSSSALVDWYNQHFPVIFPIGDDIATGAISYSPAKHTQDATIQSGTTLKAFAKLESIDAEAMYIAKTITKLREETPEASIAILLRTKSQITELLPWLRFYDLSYQAHDMDPLNSKVYIHDVLSLLKALTHLSDKLAWLSLLRAPFVGLSLADLLVLAKIKTPYLWQAIQSIPDALSDDGKVILNRIIPILTEALSQKHSLPWADLLQGAWQALGGHLTLPFALANADIEVLLSLVAEHASFGMVYDWAPLERIVAKRFAASQSNAVNPIAIMTIHKSKGLEFDIVFIPGLERTGRQNSTELLLWHEQVGRHGEVNLLLAPIKASGVDADPVYNYIREQHKRKDNYELTRILYVACTRAKQQLFLSAYVDATHVEEVKPHSNSYLAKLWPTLGQGFIDSLSQELSISETNLIADDKDLTFNLAKRLPIDWQREHSRPLETTSSRQDDQHNRHLLKQILGEDPLAKQRGIVIHSLLELFAATPTKHWPEQLTSWIDLGERLLKQAGASITHSQANRTWLQSTLTKMTQDPKCLWLFDPSHQEAMQEIALLTKQTDKTGLIRIDRTFIDKDGTRWIIDYKTSELTEEAMKDFVESTWPKYQAQLLHYANALAALSPHPIRLGLYFPCVAYWFEWAFELEQASL